MNISYLQIELSFLFFSFFFKSWFARVLVWINLKEKCINLKIRNEGGSKVTGALA